MGPLVDLHKRLVDQTAEQVEQFAGQAATPAVPMDEGIAAMARAFRVARTAE